MRVDCNFLCFIQSSGFVMRIELKLNLKFLEILIILFTKAMNFERKQESNGAKLQIKFDAVTTEQKQF